MSFVRQLARYFLLKMIKATFEDHKQNNINNLKFFFSGIQIYASMIPAWPNGEVNAKENQHMLPKNKYH